MVHLRSSGPKTYVPVPGFGERPTLVLPQWAMMRTRLGRPRRGTETRGGRSAATSGVQVYQQNYFNVSSMRNQRGTPRTPRTPIGTLASRDAEGTPHAGPAILPCVTGTGITPQSPCAGSEDQVSAYDNIDSVSVLGGVDVVTAHQGAGDNQSVTTLDGQSDQTMEDRSLTMPLQVTFTKASPRAQSRRAPSPKSVRFSLPENEAACPEPEVKDVVPEDKQGGVVLSNGVSSKTSDSGSVVDGFFVHSMAWPPHPDITRTSSVVGSVSGHAQPTCSSPTTTMRYRGALSNARQIPGRYFPPLALSDDHRFSQLSSHSSLRRTASASGPHATSGSSVVSAPPSLGAANITQLPRGGIVPSFAVTSSYSWSGQSSPHMRTKNINNSVCADPQRGRPVKPLTMHLGSPGRPKQGPLDNINRDTNRDTVYNRNKKGFWEMYDADPGRFTISFREENSGYDPTSVLQSEYYSVRKSAEVAPSRGSSAHVRRKSGSGFHGCLEGTTKCLHTKMSAPQTFLEP